MRSRNFYSPVEQAKRQARELRLELAKNGEAISHSRALEKTANQLGYRDWNTAAARLSNHPDVEVQVGDHVRGRYLKQPFTARIVSVTEQGQGAYYQLALDLDEAVDVVTFDSFSAYRKRVTGRVNAHGDSPAKTSDGEPQLVILGHVHD
ncbi:MAG: glyoxalase superfamily protein [Pseudomonadota bacterium]